MNTEITSWKKNPLLLKVLTIIILIILLMIPTVLIQELVSEREGTERDGFNVIDIGNCNDRPDYGLRVK